MCSVLLIEQYVKLPELLDRVEGDRELLVELFGLFLEELPGNRDALLKAIDAGDLEKTAGAAHKMKGMLANLSAFHMASLASEIELAARARDPAKMQLLVPDLDAAIDGFSAALNAFLTGVQT